MTFTSRSSDFNISTVKADSLYFSLILDPSFTAGLLPELWERGLTELSTVLYCPAPNQSRQLLHLLVRGEQDFLSQNWQLIKQCTDQSQVLDIYQHALGSHEGEAWQRVSC